MGYSLDAFWLHDPEMRGPALARILRHRNIRGLIVVGLMNENRLPDHFIPVVESLPCVVTGVRTREPTLSFAAVDHHALALTAVEKALGMGYRRPALVLDAAIDRLVDQRFSGGFLMGCRALRESCRIPPFYSVEAARSDPAPFHQWLVRHQPDVIFTLYNVVARWLERTGWRVPEDVGLIQLEWRASRPNWAGMDQHNDRVGEAAVDLLVGMLHADERGVPSFPRSSLIGSSWVDGGTVRARPGLTPRRPLRPAG